MTSKTPQQPVSPLDAHDAARQVADAVATVQALVAAGLVDARTLGLGSAPDPTPPGTGP